MSWPSLFYFGDSSINFCISLLKLINHVTSYVSDYRCFGEVTAFCYNLSKFKIVQSCIQIFGSCGPLGSLIVALKAVCNLRHGIHTML